MSRRFRLLLPVAILTAATAVACYDARLPMSAETTYDSIPSGKSAAPRVAADMMARPEAVATMAAAAPGRPGTPLPSAGAVAQPGPTASSMIIRNGWASVEVDSLERAIAAVQRIAVSLGGYVGNTALSSGDYEVRRATLELKIPSARYDDALAGLSPIGKVESVSSTAEDVGEEFVDLTARTANARRLEERLITLLATRTGKLEDVLNVERELARVREEIERYDGRLRYLRSRVATSTLSVTVHERAPLVAASPGENIIAESFKDAWRNFVRFVAGFIAALGTIVPVVLLAGMALVAWRRFGPARLTGRLSTATQTARQE